MREMNFKVKSFAQDLLASKVSDKVSGRAGIQSQFCLNPVLFALNDYHTLPPLSAKILSCVELI